MSDNLKISLLPLRKDKQQKAADKPLCLYPWFHQKVNTDGSAIPCCNWTIYNKVPYKEFFSSDSMQTIREEMLFGEIPIGCKLCIHREQVGSFSGRDIANELARKIGYVYDGNPVLLYQEIDFSNLCNVRCKMCNSARSYKIAGDEKNLGISSSSRLESSWTLSEKDLYTIKMLRFLGGEPLLHTDRIIYELNRLKNVGRLSELNLCINTNMMTPLSSNFLEIALQCKDVNINASIDAFGNLNSYIRTDSDWDTVLSNFLILEELAINNKNFSYQPVHTISILNCNKLHELYKFCEDAFLSMSAPLSGIYVTHPQCYDIGYLPQEIKKILIDRYSKIELELPTWNAQIKSIKNILSSTLNIKPSKYLIEELNKRNAVFDRRCKFTFEDVNKEMYDWLK